jgi:hypothetical protein
VAEVLGHALQRADAAGHERVLAGVAADAELVQALEHVVLLLGREGVEDDDERVGRGGRHLQKLGLAGDQNRSA